MKKIITYILSGLTIATAFLALVIFDPIQRIALNVFGYQAHKKVVDILNWILMRCANLTGATFDVEGTEKLPKDIPLVLVSNHQSMYDIVCIIWFLRKVHPKFISKIELGKNIPSISYNLKNSGAALIDRKNPRQAIPEIKKVAEYIEKNKRSVAIFPEGTRSRTGVLKPFAKTGLQILYKNVPNGYFVPITINNSYKLLPKGFFPLGLGAKIKLTVGTPLKISDYDFDTIFQKTQEEIQSHIEN